MIVTELLDLKQRLQLSRRRLLGAGLGLAATVPLSTLLAACGGDDDDDDDSGEATEAATEESSGSEETEAESEETEAESEETEAAADETEAGSEETEAEAEETEAEGDDAGDEGEPVMGGSLSMSLADADVSTFDPIIPTDNMAIWTMLLIYDQLSRVAPDGLSLEPGLAESWDIAEDGLHYTFNLRDANFHDGTPVTADDVIYCYDRMVNSPDSQWAWLFSAIDTVEASDDKTVAFTLSQVWVPFISDVALFGSSIIPKAAHEAQGDALWEAPIGSGPFKFDSWEKDSQIVLLKNEDYWEEGKPYLDELTFLVLTDANTRMLKFQAGELDIATSVPYSQLDALQSDSNVQVLTDGPARNDLIYFNNTKAPLDDINLRKAINYGVDKQAIIDNVLFGYGVRANTMLPPMLYHADELEGYPYDLEKAKEHLAQSAYPDGTEFEIIVGSGDPVAQQMVQLIQAQLGELNIQVNIRLAEPGSATEEIQNLQHQASKGYYTTDIVDPDELIVFAFSPLGGINAFRTGYQDDEVDQLIADAQTETDEAKREEMYHRIQEIHNEAAPVLLLYYPMGSTALKTGIHNFKILPTGNYRLWEVWRDQ